MSPILFTNRSALPLFILFLLSVSLACNTITSGSNAPGDEPSGEISVEQEISFGPGPFAFPDPNAGLSNLSAYTATLKVVFDGVREGKAEKWSKTYVMLTTREPAARQLTIESNSELADLDTVLMAEREGLSYEKRGETACETSVIEDGNLLADRFEPASFLGGVIGAEEAGAETINDIPATHYTFDQRALGKEGVTESAGELWVADEVGYLVKYLLTTKAGEEYFGEGIEGTITFDYELTAPNQPVEMILPEDCPPGLVDAPLLPDATNIENIPGNLSYDTMSSLADAAAFYQQNIADLGWQAEGEPAVTDGIAVLTYTQGDRIMLIIIKPGDSGTRVRITASKAKESVTP
jgi:hypothetical protein